MMIRKIALAGAAGVAGYAIGVRAGFDAAVRDYFENGGRLLLKVADEKNKFDYNLERVNDGSGESAMDEEDGPGFQ